MSARKKPWIKSAFSELNLTQTTAVSEGTPAKRTRSTPHASTKTQRNRNVNSTPTLAAALVDITAEDEDGCGDNSESPPTVTEKWMESFAPTSSEELAVHPKKIGELRDWLRHCEAMRWKVPAQICLLSGPTGAGKTATLQVLAKEFGYQLQEWINPVDCEVINTLGDQPSGGSYLGSHLEAFKSFLLRASRYKSLLNAQNKRLVLVEDFPNVLLSDAEANFDDLLEKYSIYGKSPLVFIVADSKSRGLNISYKLFPDQLKAKHRINHISFNSIAATIMQKSMKTFCAIMQQKGNKALYKVPSSTVVDSIVVGAQGDIRNALINLHLSALKGVPNMPTKQLNVSVTSKGRQRKMQSTLKSIGRDESITLMHAVGRVLNPKCNEEKRLQHSPEVLTEAFCTEPRNFVNFIHANYLPHFRDIEDVLPAINDLCLSDFMLNEYRDDALPVMGLNLAIRGTMLANKDPVSGWMPVRGPKRINVLPPATLAEQKLLGIGCADTSKALYATEYKSFVKCIAARSPKEMPIENEQSIED
ncbi:cell cycle checkpoint protein RAD17 isoform X1 [Drosophila pseudoobscura]|uniref:Cell cycle checkpoint protein RAD17 isoform X1 n=2 Tax=Drosophila pseudoobscura pseudoobscura TaxID=46245 RepID=A0A6I8V229_DROPS|nr:cell cycle checkpoint protein RAD17 isoform X1 [Drosophila pseudoobscura]